MPSAPAAESGRCRIVTWNLERKKPTAPRGAEALDVVFGLDADIVALTEARTGSGPGHGHLLPAPVAPVGERFGSDERKVVLWSKRPWRDVDHHLDQNPDLNLDQDLDPDEAPGQGAIDRSRFVMGTTETPIGPVTVIGVCIPWHMAEVTNPTGPSRKPWELHLAYLRALAPVLERCRRPVVVAGDANQRIPRRKGGHRAAAEALAATFGSLSVVTAGPLPGTGRQGIDHIACSDELEPAEVWGWRNDVTGRRLSDHDGAGADLARRLA